MVELIQYFIRYLNILLYFNYNKMTINMDNYLYHINVSMYEM